MKEFRELSITTGFWGEKKMTFQIPYRLLGRYIRRFQPGVNGRQRESVARDVVRRGMRRSKARKEARALWKLMYEIFRRRVKQIARVEFLASEIDAFVDFSDTLKGITCRTKCGSIPIVLNCANQLRLFSHVALDIPEFSMTRLMDNLTVIYQCI